MPQIYNDLIKWTFNNILKFLRDEAVLISFGNLLKLKHPEYKKHFLNDSVLGIGIGIGICRSLHARNNPPAPRTFIKYL